jgi:hypothetical protein
MTPEKSLPIKPKGAKWLFEHSDLIAYTEIISVDKEVDYESPKEPVPGVYPVFGEQRCKAKILKVLKGLEELEDRSLVIIKRRSRYYLTEGQKVVLYLEKQKDTYQTIDPFGGEHRLASALSNVNNLRKDTETGGVVAGVLNKKEEVRLKIHIIKGRQKAGITIGDKIWKEYLFKSVDIGKFDIAEIPLKGGRYTILLEHNGNLHPHSRIIDGYYPYVIIRENNWKPLYFDINKIK